MHEEMTSDEDRLNAFSIKNRLNNINTSLAMVMQGPMSLVLVYLPSTKCLHYYRGIIGKKMDFGQEVEKLTIPYFFQSSLSTIYDKEEKVLFSIQDEDDAQIIVNNIMKNICMFDELPIILSQLEVILSPTRFMDIVECVFQKSVKYALSKKEVLQYLYNWKEDIHGEFPSKDIYDILNQESQDLSSPYSKKWLISFLLKINGFKTLLEVNNNKEYNKMFEDVFLFLLKQQNSLINIYKTLGEALSGCVPMRSSYGIRKKGLAQIVCQHKIAKNVEKIQSENFGEDDRDEFFYE